MSKPTGFFVDCDVTSLAAPGVRQLQPYQPGKPIPELEREYGVSNIIKLASNENPLGASPLAIEAMTSAMPDLALYPDGGGFELKQALADMHGLTPAHITLGNGSNDVLVLIAGAFLTSELEAVYSQYCFALYPIAVQAVGAVARVADAIPPGTPNAMGHDLDAMAGLVGHRTRVVFIANPNNPTGTWLETNELRAFIQALPSQVLVVVDEAYFEYSRSLGLPDASQWIPEFPNLIVTRTFSKALGLAGIRVGYSLSSPGVADMLNRIRQPFNVNSLALAGATAALADHEFIEQSVSLNREGLEQLQNGLNELGIATVPSAANFLLADMGVPAASIYDDLLHMGIIVRPMSSYGLPDHLRITVGTRQQNQSLLSAMAAITDNDKARRA